MSGNHSLNGLAQPKTIIRNGLLALAAIAAALALSALVADSASAQQPAICDQYPQLPQCDDQGGGGGGGGDGGGGVAGESDSSSDDDQGSTGDETTGTSPGVFPGSGGGPTAGAGGGTGGELPFTGYPLTPLLLILLLLLAAGLVIRAYVAARERWRLRHQGAPSVTAF